jgi:glycine cleavage system transcriptional repressor
VSEAARTETVAITAVGQDRPGIVAEVSGVLYAHGCNLEEASMTRLRDQFAMQLLVRLPAATSTASLRTALEQVAGSMGLSLVVRPLLAEAAALSQAVPDSYIVRVYGADRPGIVHQVTALLARHGVNIVDLETRVLGRAGGPVYVMLLQVDLPDPAALGAVEAGLDALRGELRVEISLSRIEEEAL